LRRCIASGLVVWRNYDMEIVTEVSVVRGR
jgi:hypothetical protein